MEVDTEYFCDQNGDPDSLTGDCDVFIDASIPGLGFGYLNVVDFGIYPNESEKATLVERLALYDFRAQQETGVSEMM